VRSIEWQFNIISTLALLSVFPVFLFLDTLFLYLSSFKSTEDILQKIKRKKDYYLNIESIRQWNALEKDLFKDEKLLRVFMLISMKNHFDFLVKYEEKMKDKTNALIPITSTCVVIFLITLLKSQKVFRQFKSEVQQELMSENKVLRKGFDSQEIF
jgi:hypothetical protein